MYRLFLIYVLLIGCLLGQVKLTPQQKKYDVEYFQLVKVLRQYQHKFRTDDITIGLRLATLEELAEFIPNSCGASLFDVSHPGIPMGSIWVLRSDQYPKDQTKICGAVDIRADQINTIVHEYCHFLLTYSATEEQTVDIISNMIAPTKHIHKKP